MSINRRQPGETWQDFRRRMREMRGLPPSDDPLSSSSYEPVVPTRMVLSPWTTDEHGNAARQLRGT